MYVYENCLIVNLFVMLFSSALIESRPAAAAARAVVQGGTQLAHLHLRRARQELARRGRPLLAPGITCPHVGRVEGVTWLILKPFEHNFAIEQQETLLTFTQY